MFEYIYLRYFAGPGYTVVQTVVFAAMLLLAVYLIYRLFLKKIDTDVDERFFWAMVPFVVLGGVLRSLGHWDAEIFTGFWFTTPGIHLLIASYAIFSILAAQYLEKVKMNFLKWMWVFGSIPTVICIYITILFGFLNPEVFLYVLGTTVAVTTPLYLFVYFLPRHLSGLNHFVLSGHILDGTSTFIAVTYFGYVEKHVLPGFLVEATGAWIMIPLKIAVIWPVLYLIDDSVDDFELKNWLKVVVLGLGLALGIRNMFSAAMGV